MTTKSVVLKRGSITRSFDQWRDDDYDVLENGVVVGRIFCLDAVGPQGRPWMWASRPQRGNTAGSARIRADARSRDGRLREELEEVAMDTLERFPLVWCDTCEKTQRMIFDVLPANDKNREAADIVCDECKSIIATLHADS